MPRHPVTGQFVKASDMPSPTMEARQVSIPAEGGFAYHKEGQNYQQAYDGYSAAQQRIRRIEQIAWAVVLIACVVILVVLSKMYGN